MQDNSRDAAQGNPDVKARKIFLTEHKPDMQEESTETFRENLRKCKN